MDPTLDLLALLVYSARSSARNLEFGELEQQEGVGTNLSFVYEHLTAHRTHFHSQAGVPSSPRYAGIFPPSGALGKSGRVLGPGGAQWNDAERPRIPTPVRP